MTESPNNNKRSDDDQLLDKTKQLVANIFRKMNENQAIPDSAKVIINNLNSRFMKIALATPNLFAFENHQTRIFLDNVCRISVEWLEVEDSNDFYLKKLDSIVKNINDQDNYNNKDFIQFQNDLEKSLEKLKKRAAIKQKREHEKLLGQKKITQAKDETDSIISKKITVSKKLPEYIEHILREEWSNVLVLLHIRNGPESKIYKSKLEFVDLLLELVIKRKSPDSYKQRYENLSKIYQNGLALVAFNKQEIKTKETELLRYLENINQPQKVNETISPEDIILISQHQQNISEKKLKTDKVEETECKAHNEVSTDQKDLVKKIVREKKPDQLSEKRIQKTKNNTNKIKKKTQKNDTQNQKVEKLKTSIKTQTSTTEESSNDNIDYNSIISSLKKGTWFEVIESDGRNIRAKLSWVSPISGNHLLVDSHGLKIANKSKSDLIAGLKDKSIKIISTY